MKWEQFRRSENVEDYRDPLKPVENKPDNFESITEHLALTNSQLAKDAGEPREN